MSNNTPFSKIVANDIVGALPGSRHQSPVDDSAFVSEMVDYPKCIRCGAVALIGGNECGKCKAIREHTEETSAQAEAAKNKESMILKSTVNALIENGNVLEKRIAHLEEQLAILIGTTEVEEIPTETKGKK